MPWYRKPENVIGIIAILVAAAFGLAQLFSTTPTQVNQSTSGNNNLNVNNSPGSIIAPYQINNQFHFQHPAPQIQPQISETQPFNNGYKTTINVDVINLPEGSDLLNLFKTVLYKGEPTKILEPFRPYAGASLGGTAINGQIPLQVGGIIWTKQPVDLANIQLGF